MVDFGLVSPALVSNCWRMNFITFSDSVKSIINTAKLAAACKTDYFEYGKESEGARSGIRILMETGDWVTLIYDSVETRDEDHQKLDMFTLSR